MGKKLKFRKGLLKGHRTVMDDSGAVFDDISLDDLGITGEELDDLLKRQPSGIAAPRRVSGTDLRTLRNKADAQQLLSERVGQITAYRRCSRIEALRELAATPEGAKLITLWRESTRVTDSERPWGGPD